MKISATGLSLAVVLTWNAVVIAAQAPYDPTLNSCFDPEADSCAEPPDALAVNESPLPAPWIFGTGVAADNTHIGGYNGYDIYSYNCHSYTNSTTLSTPVGESRGALVCDPRAASTPAWHSASWSVFEWEGEDWTCIYNYGSECCWPAGDVPPDVSAGDGATCAKWACDKQYRPGVTTTLGAGELVEIPGPAACVRETATAINSISVNGQQVTTALDNALANQSACVACCDRRGQMWNGSGYDTAADKNNFINQCKTLCNGFYADGTSAGAGYANNVCVPGVSFWSTSSNYEQCRGCCLDAAIAGTLPRTETSSCIATCGAAYP